MISIQMTFHSAVSLIEGIIVILEQGGWSLGQVHSPSRGGSKAALHVPHHIQGVTMLTHKQPAESGS